MKNLQFLNHHEINIEKWDLLVEKFSNGLPYAYSWYLDSVCENWGVFIYGDYEAGFAFQIKKKYGLAYSLQPFLVQQLGFFGEDDGIFQTILKEIDKLVFHYHYQLNYFNKNASNIITARINYELFLDTNFENIQTQYKTNTKRNLKKALSLNTTVTTSSEIRPEDISFIKKNSKIQFNDIRLEQFNKLIISAKVNAALEIYRAKSNSKLTALIIFIKTKTRAVYLMAVTNKEGLNNKANFLLVNQFIKNNANSDIILDFEGSNIEGIARFYAGFGANKTTYQEIKKTSFKNIFQKLLK